MTAYRTALVAFDVAFFAYCTAISRLAMALAWLSNTAGFHDAVRCRARIRVNEKLNGVKRGNARKEEEQTLEGIRGEITR